MTANVTADFQLPDWVPDALRLYLDHTEDGTSLRELARQKGCHPSTVLRQVRRYENRRDDPLMDEALARLARLHAECAKATDGKDPPDMTAPLRPQPLNASRIAAGRKAPADHVLTDEAQIAREARRILRRLSEPRAVLALATDMEKAAVLRSLPGGATARIAVVSRAVAEAFALRDWITCQSPGRVATYRITSAGRAALKRMLDEDARSRAPGMAEAATPFADQHREWGERDFAEDGDAGDGETGSGARRRLRYNLAESPVAALARRRDRDGKPFLTPDLVAAAERLREDFELAQMGPRVAQNWDRLLTGGDRGGFRAEAGPAQGPRAARDRVAMALRDLGPGLGDMALRCCCYLEGLEGAERRLGWSARSGKIVLRIALMRLRRHYEEGGKGDVLIG